MFLKVLLLRNKPHPVAAMFFDWPNSFLAIFVEGHLVIISVKLFLILTTSFRRDVISFLYRYIRETGQALGGHVF